MSPDAERDTTPLSDVAGSALGCWTCQTVSHLEPGDPRFQLRLLAFLAEHDAGHRPWIDLTGRVPQQAAPVD